MNRAHDMRLSPHPRTCVALMLVFLISLAVTPLVSAAPPSSVTTTATVPPVLLACARATNPIVEFSCSFPGDPSASIPDGPPYSIKCIDKSSIGSNQSIASWNWDFGDGGSSTDQNPWHTYSEASLYEIRLTVGSWCGSQYSNTTSVSLSTFCSVPEPAFTINVTEGFAPLAVQVTDASKNTPEGVTRWTYWFDDTHTSYQRNPVFIYSTPGTYMINQTVWKDCVRISSTLYPPLSRRIIVHPPLFTSPGSNGSADQQAAVVPGTGLFSTTAAGASGTRDIGADADVVQTVPGIPGTGTLSVMTEPAGAQIYVDNVPRGVSPATVPDLPAGTHTLRLEREGYKNMTVPVLVHDGTAITFGTTLAPESGGIAIVPVIVLTIIVIGVIGMGIYLFKTLKKE